MIAQHRTKPALKDGLGNNLTYGEMGARVNRIASTLIAVGAAPGSLVAVFQDPSADWICSMLAIFRIGATYIPLDLRNSIHRLTSIVKASKPAIILTDRSTTEKTTLISADDAVQINVSEIATSLSQGQLPNEARPDSHAVILFTSGSTGEPKGVIMKHSNLAAECEAYSKFCDLPAGNSVVMQQSIFSFDFSLEQTFVALADGGCLYVVPADKRGDPHEISKLMVEQGVTYTSGTPSEYEMLFKYASETLAKCKTWRYAFGGGEYLSPSLIREFAKLPLPNLRLFNNYGPAEVTTAALKGEIAYRETELEEPTLAGFILPNYKLYFVDKDLQPVPVGVPGEIVVGGPGVTVGYLGMEETTKAHYIPNKFGPSPPPGNDRLYRTGDLGRLREDGGVYWISRIEGDTQVKLRGFRIELKEIEAVLIKHSNGALSHAVVTLRGNGEERFLAAHIVFVPDYPQEQREGLIRHLESRLPLPSYMQPSVLVPLDEMPLTAHSKIDRKAIQAIPLPDAFTSGEQDTVTGIEKKTAELWRRIIPHTIRDLAPETNFFDVGGNSILLVKLQALMKKTFNATLPLVDLMNSSTLGKMARMIKAASRAGGIDWEIETSLPESLRGSSAAVSSRRKKHDNLSVVLVGASGYLGRNLLPHLVEDPRVKDIYCLVRKEGPATNSSPPSTKVKFIQVDLSQPNFDLLPAEFTALAEKADAVVNCAANRSFWDSYESLRPVNVDAVKELARLCLANNASLHMLSSGAVQIYDSTTPPTDGSDGYVASKWAAETFLRKAAAEKGLQVYLHRPVPAPSSEAEKTTDISAAAVLEELIGITRTLGKRPDFTAVGGHIDVVPVGSVVNDLVASITSAEEESGRVAVIPHEGRLRLSVKDFADHIQRDGRIKDLPVMDPLHWFRDAKIAGFGHLITSQHLSMSSKNGELVTRR